MHLLWPCPKSPQIGMKKQKRIKAGFSVSVYSSRVRTRFVSTRFVSTRFVSTRFVSKTKNSFRENSFREQRQKLVSWALVSWALVSWAKKKTRFVKTRFVSSDKNSFREQFHESREQKRSRVSSRVFKCLCQFHGGYFSDFLTGKSDFSRALFGRFFSFAHETGFHETSF